jgi:hypothetical protein
MSDLQLEVANTEVKQTTLIASPGNLGTSNIMDFTGGHVLECIPDKSLISAPINNFGGIFGRGVGSGIGVHGTSTSGAGVMGETDAVTSAGVHGRATKGTGVLGEASGGTDSVGVLGRHGDNGVGVLGNGNPGVVGRCRTRQASKPTREPPSVLAGVAGESIDGPGVFGAGHVGGKFSGTSAQLALVPGSGTGKPTTGHHVAGEIFMDSAGSLFVCIGTSPPSGTWVKVVTVPA